MPQYILFHKPYGVLSQFTPEDGARSLAEFDLPKGVYPAGRLDKDSEGLLLLTDDGPLIEQLLNPKNEKPKTYWALVERMPEESALQRLREGVRIEDYTTLPCEVQLLDPQPTVAPRDPPVRVRKSVQDVWLEITVVEGKNRQVRKMTAAIGHPTLRLIRRSIANLQLQDDLPLGTWKAIAREDIAWGAALPAGEWTAPRGRAADAADAQRRPLRAAAAQRLGGGGVGRQAGNGRRAGNAAGRAPGQWFNKK